MHSTIESFHASKGILQFFVEKKFVSIGKFQKCYTVKSVDSDTKRNTIEKSLRTNLETS